MLLMFAWSSVFFDLNSVYMRTTELFLDIERPVWTWPAQPSRYDGRKPLEWEEAQAAGMRLMDEQAREYGFAIERPLALYILRDKGLYEYRVRSSRDIGDKYGATAILFDAYTGELRTVSLPTGQRSGNTLTTWLIELHMANVFGLPYRIFVCGLGLVITMLSVTGVYIWWKKRRARNFLSRISARRRRGQKRRVRRYRGHDGSKSHATIFRGLSRIAPPQPINRLKYQTAARSHSSQRPPDVSGTAYFRPANRTKCPGSDTYETGCMI